MESILSSIKKRLGISKNYTYFDEDIIMDINSALMVLNQLGIGPPNGFVITGDNESWEDYISDVELYELVQTYIYLKVRLVFDPPQTGPLMEAMERRVSEFEWRLNVQSEEVVKNGR